MSDSAGPTEPGPEPSRLTSAVKRPTDTMALVLMVLAAAMSAVALWQAAVRSNEAADLLRQARLDEALANQQRSANLALLDFDRSLELAISESEKARNEFLEVWVASQVAPAPDQASAQEMRRTMLEGLRLTDNGSGSLQDRLEQMRQADIEGRVLDPTTLRNDAAQLRAAERAHFATAVILAAGLFILTLLEASRTSSWRRRWLLVALGLVAAGTAATLFTLPGALSGQGLPGELLAHLGAASTVALVAWAIARRLRRSAPWWANVLEGASVVLLTLAALGLAWSSGMAERANAGVDSLTAAATETLDIDLSQAVNDLRMIGDIAVLDAWSALDHTSADVSALLTSPAPVWERVGDSIAEPLDTPVPAVLEDVIGATTLADLLSVREIDELVFRRYVAAATSNSLRLTAEANLIGNVADDWGGRADVFTVSLVVLGLAAFLLSKASKDRPADVAEQLLGFGAIGVVVGLSLGTSALAGVSQRPSDDDISAAAEAYARGRTTLIIAISEDDCVRAQDLLTEAIDRVEGFAGALLDRGDARFCDSNLPLGELDEIAADYERGLAAGGRDPRALGNLGFLGYLRHLETEDHRDLQSAIDRNAAALDIDPTNPVWLFNAALYALADGASEEHVADLFGKATDCARFLGRGHSCVEGNGHFDELTTRLLLVSAFNDLERIEHERGTDVSAAVAAMTSRIAGTAAAAPAAAIGSVDRAPQSVTPRFDPGEAGDDTGLLVVAIGPIEQQPWLVQDVRWGRLSELEEAMHFGAHVDAWNVRIDLYQGGRLVDRAELPAVASESGELLAYDLPRIGTRILLPIDYVSLETPAAAGLMREFASPDGEQGVVLARFEGLLGPEGLREQLDVGLGPLLGESVPIDEPIGSLGGVTFSQWYPDTGVVASIGYTPYLSDGCPGTVVAVWAYGFDGPADPDAVGFIESIAPTSPPLQVGNSDRSPDAGGSGREHTSAGFRIGIPEGWNVVEDVPSVPVLTRPLAAIDCTEGTNLNVVSQELALVADDPEDPPTLEDYVNLQLEELPTFGGSVISHRPMATRTGQPAIVVDYTIELEPEVFLYGIQVYAMDDTTAYVLTVTVPAGDGRVSPEHAALVEEIIASFDLTSPPA